MTAKGRSSLLITVPKGYEYAFIPMWGSWIILGNGNNWEHLSVTDPRLALNVML